MQWPRRQDTIYDVAIVGGGPAGLSAALVLGRMRRSTVVVDAGLPRNRHAHSIQGLLSREGTSPADLLAAARLELSAYPTVALVQGVAEDTSGSVGEFAVKVGEEVLRSKRLVLAAGLVDELPTIEGLKDLWGKSVLHCPYCHGWEVRDRPLAVLGSDDAAVLLASHLTHLSDDVILCTHGVDISPDSAGILDSSGIGHRSERIQAVHQEGTGIDIRFTGGPSLSRGALFVKPTTRASGLGSQLGCELLDDGSVEINDFGQTSVPGVYAAGDLARRRAIPFPMAQVGMAAAAGSLAGVVIDQELLFEETYSPKESDAFPSEPLA